MFKALTLLALMISTSLFADVIHPQMSMKERIRISLWVEGISQDKLQAEDTLGRKEALPEEIERALKKL